MNAPSKLQTHDGSQDLLFSVQEAKDSLARYIACKFGVSISDLRTVDKWTRADDKSFTENEAGNKTAIIFEFELESQGKIRLGLISESLLDEIASEIKDTAEWLRRLRSFWHQYGSLASANTLVPQGIKTLHKRLELSADKLEKFYLGVAKDLSKTPQTLADMPTTSWGVDGYAYKQYDPTLTDMIAQIAKTTQSIDYKTTRIVENTTPKSEPRDRIIALVNRINVEMFDGKSIPKAVDYVRFSKDVAEQYMNGVMEARQFAVSFVRGASSRMKNEESFWNGIKKEAQPSAAKSAARRKSRRSASPSAPPGPVPILDGNTGGGLY